MRLIFCLALKAKRGLLERVSYQFIVDYKLNVNTPKYLNNWYLLVCLYTYSVSTSQNADGLVTNGLFQTTRLLVCLYDFTLYYRSVVLKLVPVAEYTWKLWGLLWTPWNTGEGLIPLYEPAAISISRKYDYINLCSIICSHKHTWSQKKKKGQVKLRLAVCVIYLLYLFAACSFMLLSPEAAQQSRSSRYQSLEEKNKNKNLDENTEHLWAAIWAMKVRKPFPAAQDMGLSDLSSALWTQAAPSTVPKPLQLLT